MFFKEEVERANFKSVGGRVHALNSLFEQLI